MRKVPKILMIFTEWNINEFRKQYNAFGGTGYYRIVKPAKALRDVFGYEVDVKGRDLGDFGKTNEEMWTNIFTHYDLIYPRHVDNPRAASDMICLGKHFKKPVLMDLDDNYLAVRDTSPAYADYHPGSEKTKVTSRIIQLVDGITVSTKPLAKIYKKLNKKVFVLPNCNDVDDWPTMKKEWGDGRIRIGWAGSTTHDEDLELIIEPVKKMLEKYPNVYFEELGGVPREKATDFIRKFGHVGHKVTIHYGTPSWHGYPELLTSLGWDIGLAPLTDNEFTRCKSHIKWMEYTMIGIPVIASRVYPYFRTIHWTPTIMHGHTGFLARTKEDWEKYLTLLIEKRDLRTKIAANSYRFVKDFWQWNKHVHRWKKVIDSYL